MDRNLQDIEDLFRSSLDDNEELPSKDVWTGVEQTLDKDNISFIKKKYSNLKRVAVVLVLLLSGLSIYDFYSSFINKKVIRESIGINEENRNSQVAKSNSEKIINSKKRSSEPVTNDRIRIINGSAKLSGEDLARTKDETVEKNKNSSSLDNQTKGKLNILEQDASLLQTNEWKKIFRNKSKNERKAYRGDRFEWKNSVPDDDRITNTRNEPYIAEVQSPQSMIGEINSSLVETKKLRPAMILKGDPNIIRPSGAHKKLQKNSIARLSKFTTTVFFSPDFAWYRLQDDVSDNQSIDADDIEKNEKHEFSSSAGALIDYTFSKHWSIQSGIMFSNTAITLEPKIIYAQADNSGFVKYRFNSSSGYSYILPSFSTSPSIGDSLYALTSIHTLQYIGVPIAINYRFIKGRFTFKSTVGFSSNFLTKGKIETRLEKGGFNDSEIITNIQGLKSMYFSGLIGVGSEYNLSKNIALTFTPTARFALSSINRGALVKSYPNSFGLITGLRIRL